MGNAVVSSSHRSWHSEQWGWELLLQICNLSGLWLENSQGSEWMGRKKIVVLTRITS